VHISINKRVKAFGLFYSFLTISHNIDISSRDTLVASLVATSKGTRSVRRQQVMIKTTGATNQRRQSAPPCQPIAAMLWCILFTASRLGARSHQMKAAC
jgi:hypothetical protein